MTAWASVALRPRLPSAGLRRLFYWHPEWWTLLLCGAAWSLLFAAAAVPPFAIPICGHPAAAGRFAMISSVPEAVLMVAAMMPPLVILPVRRAAFASLWRRRHRAAGGFLIGYGLVWLAAAAAMLPLLADLRGKSAAASAAFAVAALWELTAGKRRALSLCHREIPLRACGWQADCDCLRFGALRARGCVQSCWAMMLAAALAPAQVAAMTAVTAIAVLQLYAPPHPQRREALLFAAMSLGFAVPIANVA